MQQLEGQIAGGAFAGAGFSVPVATLVDNQAGVFTWSGGALVMLSLPAQPTIARPWTLYGFSVGAQGMHVAGGVTPVRGFLGRLFASLIAGGTVASLPATKNAPFQTPPSSALQNMITLWDGSADPPFPMFDGTNLPPGGYVQSGLQLPQPLILAAGAQLALGIWLAPSLTSGVETIIWNVTYSVQYDT